MNYITMVHFITHLIRKKNIYLCSSTIVINNDSSVMKRPIISIYILLFLNLFSGVFAQQTFELNGKINNPESGNISLKYYTLNNGKWTQKMYDTTITKGHFTFKGELNEPVKATLTVDTINLTLYLEPTVMTIEIPADSPEHFALQGSRTEDDYRLFEQTFKAFKGQRDKIDHQRMQIQNELKNLQQSTPKFDALLQKSDSLYTLSESYQIKQADFVNHFAYANPDSYYPILSSNLSSNVVSGNISLDSARIIFDHLNDNVKHYSRSIIFNTELKERENAQIGRKAANFETIDSHGNKIALSDFNGNYVLLDFWASYCKPCITSIPHLKELYQKYHDKGFEIISISTDIYAKSWRKGIEKHQLYDWPQVMATPGTGKNDNKNIENIMQIYPVNTIPMYILIDRDGIILQKWVEFDKEIEKEQNDTFKKIFGH